MLSSSTSYNGSEVHFMELMYMVNLNDSGFSLFYCFFMFLGQAPSRDMSPTSGTIYFVSNEARQMIRINILPDDEPEGKEVWYLIPVHSLMQKSPLTIVPEIY